MSTSTAAPRRRTASAAPPSPYRVHQAMLALAEARERLLAIEPDMPESDQRLYLDCLDGDSGDAFEVIDRIINAALDAADLAALAAGRAKALAERRARFDKREKMLRGVVQQMLEALDLSKVERADFTLSVRPGQPHVIVTDEALLPPALVRTKTEPDKTLIGAALKAGREVPGAVLSNSASSLQVRVT